MTFIMLLSTALRALRYHKIRTILTMLGIIIGIAALITTMAIGRGAQKKLKLKFPRWETTQLPSGQDLH